MRTWLRHPVEPASDSLDFAIERDGEVIGKAGAWRLPEVGYVLHPDHWGKGLAHEAMVAVIEHVFAAFDGPQLTAEADPRNTASPWLSAKPGLAETGRAERTLPWRDEWCDSVYLALRRPG